LAAGSVGAVADRDLDALEAQILEVQELELRTAIFSADRMQTPVGRLIHFGNLKKAGAQAIVLLAKGFPPQA
jgi:hypothetical protein